ncbi:MAG: glycerate kinase family protein [Tepidiformaceae bacterium]
MRVLIAPQEFKGSLGADEAAAAIARGLGAARPGWELDILPLADGGPGFLDALRRAVPAHSGRADVHDAIGRKVLGRYLWLRATRTAVVEAAQANGLYHLSPGELDPLRADTFGVGELVAAALEERPARLVVGVGGSATTDGGAGMARALGARLTDEAGNELAAGGAALASLARIDWRPPPGLAGVDVVVATDVTNPLVGREGAAAVFAPQKGATADDVEVLEAALVRYAAVVRRSLGVDVAAMPGAGAAGGLAAGLVAFLGGRIESGFEVVAEATGLRERLADADVIVTGEGSFDAQSLRGKGTGRLRELAAAAGKSCIVFAGVSEFQGREDVRVLSALEPDTTRSREDAAALLAELARRWAEAWEE